MDPEVSNPLDLAECAICLEVMQEPTTLLCGHSMCLFHCDQLKQNVKGTNFVIVCPHCRQQSQYTTPLKVNIALRSVIQALMASKSTNSSSNSSSSASASVGTQPNPAPAQTLSQPLHPQPQVQQSQTQHVRLEESGSWNKETVRALQKFLATRFPGVIIDGDFGVQTISALQVFLSVATPLPLFSKFNRVLQGSLQLFLAKKGYYSGLIDAQFGTISVKSWQKYLAQMTNKNISIDGQWGKQTTTVLQQFLLSKQCNPGPIDGIFGPETVQALCKFLRSNQELQNGKSGEKIAGNDGSYYLDVDGAMGQQTTTALQSFLQIKGFSPGPIDGMLGPETVYALQRFLNANTL